MAEFIRVLPERSVKRLIVGNHCFTEKEETILAKIQEYLTDNFCIVECAIRYVKAIQTTMQPITLRNRFLQKQQRFKKTKAIQN